MAIAPLPSIPTTIDFNKSSMENQDNLALAIRSPSTTANNARSTGSVARRTSTQRSVAEDLPQTLTPSRTQTRYVPRSDTSALAAQKYTPKNEVVLSYGLTSSSNETTTRTVGNSSTSGTRVAQATTEQTSTVGNGASSTTATAKQVLAAYDALLQRALGAKSKLPTELTHPDRIKYTAEAMKSLSPANKVTFSAQAEAIGKILGLNFGLTKTDAAGKRISLNDGVAAKLQGTAADEYKTVMAQLPAATAATPGATGTVQTTGGTETTAPTAQSVAAAVTTALNTVDDGNITAEEIAAQKDLPRFAELAAAWKIISPDGKPVTKEAFETRLAALLAGQANQTPTTTPTTPTTSTTDTASAVPDAAAFKALNLQSALATVGKMSNEDIAVMVKSWANGGETLTRAQFQDANPAMAAAYVGDGKDTISVATLTETLTKLTGEQATVPTSTLPTTDPVTPTAGTQK